MRYARTALIALFGIMTSASPMVAHHGAATFDTGKKVDMEGTVTEWVWSNPHCFLKFDVKDASGTVRSWVVETSNPPDMVNRGWSRRSFKVGETVKVVVEPVKSGNPVGRLLEVRFADGRILTTQGPVTPGAAREGGAGE